MNSTPIKFSIDAETGLLFEDDAKKYFSVFGWFCFAFFGITYLFSNLAIILLLNLFPTLLDFAVTGHIITLLGYYAVALPLSLPILKKLPKVDPLDNSMSPSKVFGAVCVAFALMLVGNNIAQNLIFMFEEARGSELVNPIEISSANSPWWVTLIFTVILAPILEEMVFRGVVCRRLLPLGEGFAIIFSSIFFALCHGNFFQLFYAFTLGCLFSLIYVKTGKLRYTIFLHMVINFVGSLVSSLIMKFVELEKMLGEYEEIIKLAENVQDEAGQEVLINALAQFGTDFAPQLLVLFAYSLVLYGLAITGAVLLITKFKKIRLTKGLLPPQSKGRAAVIFLNSGIAAAITVFVIVLLLSLL